MAAKNTAAYPSYIYYPRWQAAPSWVANVVQVLSMQQAVINTATRANTSDVVLQLVRPGLEAMGFQVEAGKLRENKLFRPVFFGQNGRPDRQYEIDSYHPHDRIALEVEGGRSTLGNAIYRDIIQMSLLVDVDYAVVAVPVAYRYSASGKPVTAASYRDCHALLEAIYGSRRLELLFKGFLLIGY
jgi:hypothetical protein